MQDQWLLVALTAAKTPGPAITLLEAGPLHQLSSDIRFWPSGDTKTGPPGGLLMGPFWGPLDVCFIGVCRVGVVGGGILCRPYGDSPQASSLDGGGRRPLPSSEEEPPGCGRIRPLRRFSLSR